MPKFDWRSPDAYDRAQEAEITGLAWECLRRNPDFGADCRSALEALPKASPEFRQRWGLSFRS